MNQTYRFDVCLFDETKASCTSTVRDEALRSAQELAAEISHACEVLERPSRPLPSTHSGTPQEGA